MNVSQGYMLLGKKADRSCTELQAFQHNKGIPNNRFDEGIEVGEQYYANPILGLVDGSGAVETNTLWVFAAGNNGADLSDPYIVYGGPVVDLWAPGTGWEPLAVLGGTDSCTGTSCSAPVVSGAAALVLATHPEWLDEPDRAELLHSQLRSTASQNLDVEKCGDIAESNRRFLDTAAAVAR